MLLAEALVANRPCLIVLGEWRWDSTERQRQLDPTEYETQLRAWLDGLGVWPDRIAVDPSAAEFRALLRNRGWVGLTTSDEQINPVKAGIQAVSSLLPPAAVPEGCGPGAEKELLGYVWDPDAQKHGEDRPLKQNDHGADGLRYVVMATRRVWRPWLTT